MLYLELISYKDLFSVASPQRRLDHAHLIASKFLLPQVSPGSSESTDPLFDLRPLFPVESLTETQNAIKAATKETIGRDIFKQVEFCLENSLAGAKFASFLLSDECARMRAYMRGTTNYIDPPLESVIREPSQIRSKDFTAARNHLRYMILYLLCQKENDALNKNFDKKIVNSGKESKRMSGSAGGLSCAIFISKDLIPAIDAAKKCQAEENQKSDMPEEYGKLISSLEMFWELFIAPVGGELDSSSYSNECYDLIEKVRGILSDSINPSEEKQEEKNIVDIAKSLAENESFAQYLSRLRDELIYDYYVNHHSKYRAHLTHECMCSEASEALRATMSEEAKANTKCADMTPRLMNGSIARLIRKAEIPEGVSRHCPVHKAQNRVVKMKQTESAKCNFNADFALVYVTGSSNDDTPTAQAALFQSNLERSASSPLSDGAKKLIEKMTIEEILPPTLVSYAMVPPLKDRAFKDPIQYGRKA